MTPGRPPSRTGRARRARRTPLPPPGGGPHANAQAALGMAARGVCSSVARTPQPDPAKEGAVSAGAAMPQNLKWIAATGSPSPNKGADDHHDQVVIFAARTRGQTAWPRIMQIWTRWPTTTPNRRPGAGDDDSDQHERDVHALIRERMGPERPGRLHGASAAGHPAGHAARRRRTQLHRCTAGWRHPALCGDQHDVGACRLVGPAIQPRQARACRRCAGSRHASARKPCP
jgi:hypothetical protein